MRRATRPVAIRSHNLSVLLGYIHRDGALSRAELTARLGLSRSTVGELVADLTALGLVEEMVPTGGLQRGRPSHVVGPHHAAPFVIGVDVDLRSVTVAAVGLGGVVLAREVLAHPQSATPARVMAMVARSVPGICESAGGPARLRGIGVGVPGAVDRRTGRIGLAPNLGWHDVAIGEVLGKELRKRTALPDGVPIEVGNDADLAMLAESLRGAARGCEDAVFLMGRGGVGAGIMTAGAPLRGRDGYAGEIGHNVLDPRGPQCHCGNRGCVETYVGADALLALAGRAGGGEEELLQLFADVCAGEPAAHQAIAELADPLGRVIVSLLNTLNPDRVLLGGFLAEVLAAGRPEIEAAVARYAFDLPGELALLAPALGADAVLVGAAEAAFTALLADPTIP